jgi:type IV pilus assembly protein PilE
MCSRTHFSPTRAKPSIASRAPQGQRGYTLIEIMIVVAIVAILAAIALPGYQDSVRKTWRNKAASCLTEMAQSMERRFTAAMSYVGPALPGNACVVEDGMAARYAFDFVAPPTANAFTLRATPQGAQVADTLCAVLTIDQVGVRTVSGTGGVNDCWQ